MTGLRVVLIACLVGLCGNAWAADPPTVPPGARVGIIDMVTSDVMHFHIGSEELSNFMRTYRGNWVPADLFDDPLIAALTAAGYQPVPVAATDKLRSERQDWLGDKPRAGRLPRGCMKELGRIMRREKLGALIVMSAGSNSEPEYVEGDRYSRLPSSVQGLGFSTSDEPIGSSKVGVFDFTQFVVVAMVDDDPELVLRDWGGNRVYDWPEFDPGENIKTLSDAQIAQLRPVFAAAIKNRIDTRVMPRLKP